MIEHLTNEAKGEVDVRLIGRIDKRTNARRLARRTVLAAAAPGIPWYQCNTRPLLIGASVGHVDITAGTIGAFVTRGDAICVLSNNHVFANEDLARAGDPILQRATYDGGKQASERVARLRFWIKLKKTGTNFVDAALGEIDESVRCDVSRLHDLVNGTDRKLAGPSPGFVDEGEAVFKIARTTGPTEGRVSAFDLDNVIVNYDGGNLRFDNQVEIEGVGSKTFSDGWRQRLADCERQDGGRRAAVCRRRQWRLERTRTDLRQPIQRVLKDLKATLLF